MATPSRYVVGIDLGTTNTAVAYVDLKQRRKKGRRAVQFFELPQLVAVGEMGRQRLMPSFLYVPGAYDLPEGATALPWDAERPYVVGTLAREQGAQVPGRLVASAKSWLCHDGVDRTADILPWRAPEEVDQVSPVEATRRYLQHVREAWNAEMAADDSALALEQQLLILTVPASFDEVARELTVRAAQHAGLPRIILLEEPLAAFYAWLADHDADRAGLEPGQLILVCDVGGGTTDFSIVGLSEGDDGELRYDRLAVGDHLMLGGDNMDHALGRHLEAELAGKPGALDVRRWQQLVHGCRRAKERLLGDADDRPDSVEVTVAGTGSGLVAGTLAGRLTRADVEQLVLDGFFPEVGRDAALQETRRSGLTELGLPYAADPAITRHLASFWRRSLPYLRDHVDRDALLPDYLLFNGGVFTPALLRERMQGIVGGWFEGDAEAGWQPSELTNPRLDVAVAMGAAYYGLVRLGEGTRVGSGSPRAYFVGVETEDDGGGHAHTAVCLVPRGVEEGYEANLEDVTFDVRANQPVTFRLYSSTTRSGDTLGDLVELQPDEAEALPPVRTALRFGKQVARQIPVQLGARLTEIGTFELWCDSVHTEHRWRLEFDLRSEPAPEVDAPALTESVDPDAVEEALDAVRAAFTEEDASPEAIWKTLERQLDMPSASWPMPLLRRIADALFDLPRDASPQAEETWWNLLSFCLRPGFGDAVDDFRMKRAWALYMQGLEYPINTRCRIAWWRFWRRVGGGLAAGKQAQIYYEARPFIQLEVRTRKDHRIYPRRMDRREKEMAWMTLASFERLDPDLKEQLSQILLQKIKQGRPSDGELWAIARLGARVPFYGPLDSVMPSDDVAGWIDALLSQHLPRRADTAHALVHLARSTGDRDRDVPPGTQQKVHRWLRKVDDTEAYRELLTDPARELTDEEEGWFVHDSMPPVARAVLDPQGIAFTASGGGA